MYHYCCYEQMLEAVMTLFLYFLWQTNIKLYYHDCVGEPINKGSIVSAWDVNLQFSISFSDSCIHFFGQYFLTDDRKSISTHRVWNVWHILFGLSFSKELKHQFTHFRNAQHILYYHSIQWRRSFHLRGWISTIYHLITSSFPPCQSPYIQQFWHDPIQYVQWYFCLRSSSQSAFGCRF